LTGATPLNIAPTPIPPEHFGDPVNEYTVVHSAAALIDLAGWTQIEIGGNDRVKFLHNFCTNDIRGLALGAGCEAFITRVQGKVLAHVFVLAQESVLTLICVPGCAERIIKHLSRYQISEDVTFADQANNRCLLLVAGPGAAAVLTKADCDAESLIQGKHGDISSGTLKATIFRNDFLGIPCYLVSCAAEGRDVWKDMLKSAGAMPVGTAAFEALRIEAGFPLYGVDITDANLAQEVNRTAQTISFSKGCYLGQEPIARIDAMGHVNQQLRGIRLSAGPIPAAGAEVFTAEAEPRRIGQVTSAAISFGTQQPVALAYLKRNFDSPGLEVRVALPGGTTAGQVFWPSR
jgi:folate-binding protein YgfZ